MFPPFRLVFLFVSWTILSASVDTWHRGPLSAAFESDRHPNIYLNGIAGVCSLAKEQLFFRPSDTRIPSIQISDFVKVHATEKLVEYVCMLHGFISHDYVLKPNSYGVSAWSMDFKTLDQYEAHKMHVVIYGWTSIIFFLVTMVIFAWTVYGFNA